MAWPQEVSRKTTHLEINWLTWIMTVTGHEIAPARSLPETLSEETSPPLQAASVEELLAQHLDRSRYRGRYL